MLKHLLLMGALATSFSSFAQTYQLTQESLFELAREASPQWEQTKLNVLSAKIQQDQALDGLTTQFNTQASYLKTKERAFAQFVPVTSPIQILSVGVTQPTRYSDWDLGLKTEVQRLGKRAGG